MLKELSHQTILALIGNAIPQELQSNMIIIGSLAAAYSFFDEQSGEGVRTKDVDCMLSPGAKAVPVATDVTQKLLDNAWTYRPSKNFPKPGTKIRQETIGESAIKRSNKDLGRVLALAYLTQEKDKDELESWPASWAHVLTEKYPDRAATLMKGVGSGLRELLRSAEDMEQAIESCQTGLLAKRRITVPILQATGRRILMTVIEPLERLAAPQ